MSDRKSTVDLSKLKPDASQKKNMAIQLRENEDEIAMIKRKVIGLIFILTLPIILVFYSLYEYSFSGFGNVRNLLNLAAQVAWVFLTVILIDSKLRAYQARMSENRILRTFLGD